MNKIIIILAIIGILFAAFAPILFTQSWSPFDFTETGQIGDTIGGITAPIIGILSIFLLVYTLLEQINFNKKQKEISIDEQFKTTFFNLLQAQREILDKISGQFSHLGMFVYEEYPQNNDIKITKKDKNGMDKELFKVKNCNTVAVNEVRGLNFFKKAKSQLSYIYESLDYKDYYRNYDAEVAYDAEVELDRDIVHGSYLSPEVEEENNEKIYKTRMPFRCAYTNDKYRISKQIHSEYKQMPEEKKIGLGYAYFYNKYETVGYYFRHLYQILKFIKSNEEEKILLLGKKPSRSSIEKIHKQFKQYAQFIQSQMSMDELLLLFYNSFIFKKARELIICYDLLENLTVQNLIKKEHNCLSALKLKDKKDLFLDLISS